MYLVSLPALPVGVRDVRAPNHIGIKALNELVGPLTPNHCNHDQTSVDLSSFTPEAAKTFPCTEAETVLHWGLRYSHNYLSTLEVESKNSKHKVAKVAQLGSKESQSCAKLCTAS